MMRYLKNIAVILILLSCVSLEAKESLSPELFCENSLVMPGAFGLLMNKDCFSNNIAEAYSGDLPALRKYLEQFETGRQVYPYYYWYYLRGENFLSALMVMMEIINTSNSYQTAEDYSKEFEFIVVSGVKDIVKDAALFEKLQRKITLQEADKRFFSILNQIILLSPKGEEGINRDAWILWKAMTILFSNINEGIDWKGDEFIHGIWNNYLNLTKDESLEGYLAFYFYFINRDGSMLPSAGFFYDKLEKFVTVSKIKNEKEREVLDNLSTLVAKFSLENIRNMPDIVFLEAKAFDIEKAAADSASSDFTQKCQQLKEREKMLSGYKEGLGETIEYNRAIYIMEGCDRTKAYPFFIDKGRIVIRAGDEYLLDTAIAFFFAKNQRFDMKQANSIISGAVLSSIGKYLKGGHRSAFGNSMIYAYYTDRIKFFKDSMFIYRLFSGGDELTNENIKENTDFIVEFFFDK